MSQLASRRLRVSGKILQPKQSVVTGGLRVALVDNGEDVESKPAGEREGELVKRRQVGQEMRRHDGVAELQQRVSVHDVLVIVRGGVGTASPRALPCFGGA